MVKGQFSDGQTAWLHAVRSAIAQQDRASELMRLIGSAEDIESESLEPTRIEFRALVEDLPMLGEINPDLYRKSMTRNAANDRG